MLSRSRFLLSLVAALLLSTLALANSVPVSATFLHSGASSVYEGTHTYPGSFSIEAGKTTPMIFAAFNNSTPVESGNAHIGGPLSGNAGFGKDITDHNATRLTSLGQNHGTIAHKNGNWAVWHQGSPWPRRNRAA